MSSMQTSAHHQLCYGVIKSLTSLVIVAMLLSSLLEGCIKFNHSVMEKPDSKIVDHIKAVVLTSGNVVTFNSAGARLEPITHVIVGLTPSGEYKIISTDSVVNYELRKPNWPATLAVNFGILFAISYGLWAIHP